MDKIAQIFVVGFHHSLLNNNERGEIFRLAGNTALHAILPKYNIKALNILQTCNRWELYGYGDINDAKELLKEISSIQATKHKMLIYTDLDALHHIFKVAAGLDSMVVGDQEILSQFKKSFVESKKSNTLDGFMERLANVSLQAAKEVRKETSISKGTTSLSYAAIQILKKIHFNDSDKILLIGLGKFGQTILKNIKEYFPSATLSLCNRTNEKSVEQAKLFQSDVIKWEDCKEKLGSFDIVITAIDSKEVLFTKNQTKDLPKHIIDLSMPSPFSKEIKNNQSIQYYSIDIAAQIVNESLKNRQNSIQPALEIIEKHIQEFVKWGATYAHSDVLKEWKNKLEMASNVCPFFQSMDTEESKYYTQKSMGNFAKFIKSEIPNEDSEKVLARYLKSHK